MLEEPIGEEAEEKVEDEEAVGEAMDTDEEEGAPSEAGISALELAVEKSLAYCRGTASSFLSFLSCLSRRERRDW